MSERNKKQNQSKTTIKRVKGCQLNCLQNHI